MDNPRSVVCMYRREPACALIDANIGRNLYLFTIHQQVEVLVDVEHLALHRALWEVVGREPIGKVVGLNWPGPLVCSHARQERRGGDSGGRPRARPAPGHAPREQADDGDGYSPPDERLFIHRQVITYY